MAEEEMNVYSVMLKSRVNRFRSINMVISTIGIVIARSIWKLISKMIFSDKDKEMKPWE